MKNQFPESVNYVKAVRPRGVGTLNHAKPSRLGIVEIAVEPTVEAVGLTLTLVLSEHIQMARIANP